ncbi:MAG TPA: hypothetical protein VL137_15160 [Polyangiaceae bacterium]|jgi:hypothetical protein|nr:hypothetical protein [Polyangiaceae bacterium]
MVLRRFLTLTITAALVVIGQQACSNEPAAGPLARHGLPDSGGAQHQGTPDSSSVQHPGTTDGSSGQHEHVPFDAEQPDADAGQSDADSGGLDAGLERPDADDWYGQWLYNASPACQRHEREFNEFIEQHQSCTSNADCAVVYDCSDVDVRAVNIGAHDQACVLQVQRCFPLPDGMIPGAKCESGKCVVDHDRIVACCGCALDAGYDASPNSQGCDAFYPPF